MPAAATVAAHTWTVTALSRREVTGADAALPMRTLAGTALVAASAAVPGGRRAAGRTANQTGVSDRTVDGVGPRAGRSRSATIAAVLPAVLAGWYAARYGAAQAEVVRDPSAGRVRAAVGAGITGLPALQGALTARGGAGLLGVAVAAAAPLGRRLARKVSPT